MDEQSEWELCTLSKIGYGLFSYALQPAKRTSASFMGAILKEYLVLYPMVWFLLIYIQKFATYLSPSKHLKSSHACSLSSINSLLLYIQNFAPSCSPSKSFIILALFPAVYSLLLYIQGLAYPFLSILQCNVWSLYLHFRKIWRLLSIQH